MMNILDILHYIKIINPVAYYVKSPQYITIFNKNKSNGKSWYASTIYHEKLKW